MSIEYYIAGFDFPINSNHLLNGNMEAGSYWAMSSSVGSLSYITSVQYDLTRSLMFNLSEIGVEPPPPAFREIVFSDSNILIGPCDCDETGKIVALGRNYAELQLSKDYGSSFINAAPAAAQFNLIAMNESVSKLLVGAYSGRLYLSTNQGSSWAEKQPGGNTTLNWQSGAITLDGQTVIAACGYDSGGYGRVYISTDGGTSWSDKSPASLDGYWYLAANYDASVIISGKYGGRIYISRDIGSSWYETRPAGNVNANWKPVAVDRSGSILYCGISHASSGRLYKSLDYGSSWTEMLPAGSVRREWYAIACNSGGEKVYAGIYGGVVYQSLNAGASWTQITSSYNSWVYMAKSKTGGILYGSAGNPLYKFYGGSFS